MKYLILPFFKGVTVFFAGITCCYLYAGVLLWTFSHKEARAQAVFLMKQVIGGDYPLGVLCWIVALVSLFGSFK